MTFVCLWSPDWQTAAGFSDRNSSARAERAADGAERSALNALSDSAERPSLLALAATLLAHAPRVRVDCSNGRAVIWADARGMPARKLAHDLLSRLTAQGSGLIAGVASTPVAAEFAAVQGKERVNVVASGRDRESIALFPLSALELPPRLGPLLFGIGVRTCGELAHLERESVEVRLGAEAVSVWRLARADDARCDTLFEPMPRELPHATLDWMDYEVTDPARLLFVINALLERVCDALAQTGEGAREIAVEFSLANRTTHVEMLRAGRATASRTTWMRLIRGALDRMKLPAAVTGIALRATKVSGREDKQGDLFDRGLVSADAVENALMRLVEDQGEVVVNARNSGHPLLEQRTEWIVGTGCGVPGTADRAPGIRYPVPGPRHGLTLQLATVPRPVTVETIPRRDHMAPARYCDARGWHDVVNAAGPDRVSGRAWDGSRTYAREYFRCVTREGVLVWLFRNARSEKPGSWYLHGWWD
ncbi:MAG TPA: hypothetical protein VJR92_15145 [Gemmatimonadaceae bacterium]|nr:hypothetical protein [Gemmatimonadaceae bacterium]